MWLAPVSYAPFYKNQNRTEWGRFKKVIPIARVTAAGEFDAEHYARLRQETVGVGCEILLHQRKKHMTPAPSADRGLPVCTRRPQRGPQLVRVLRDATRPGFRHRHDHRCFLPALRAAHPLRELLEGH